MADQTNHLTRFDVQVDAAIDLPVAVAKAHVAHLDAALYLAQWHGFGGLGHAGDVVQNVKNALGG